LEEVDVKESLENSSIWETITTYLYNTGDKALNVASTALKILAGVLEINIWGPNGSLPPTAEVITVPCDTNSTTSAPSTSTQTTTTTTTTPAGK
jgi:hypothetical protein